MHRRGSRLAVASIAALVVTVGAALIMSLTGQHFAEAVPSLARFHPVLARRAVLAHGSYQLHVWLVEIPRYLYPPACKPCTQSAGFTNTGAITEDVSAGAGHEAIIPISATRTATYRG